MYFTGYTNDEKEAISFLMSTLDLSKPNKIKDIIVSSIKPIELQHFIDGVFDLEYVEEIDTRKELKIPGMRFKKSIPSNVLDWCKNGNGYHVFEEVQQLASWYNSLTGKNFVGGTSIGRSPQTLILDITYQGSEVYIDSGSIKVCGEIVESRKDLKIILEKNFKYV